MLGLGAVMSDKRSGAGAGAYAWVRWSDWIEMTHHEPGLDTTETAMSLTLAMSRYSWQGLHMCCTMACKTCWTCWSTF